MNSKITKTAAVIAFVIGAMSIFGGVVVVAGKSFGYYVIDWLPIYNLILGVISAFFTGILIWKNYKMAMSASIATFVSHAIVLLVLQTAYRDVVAPESIKAMIFRIVVWLIILTLMILQARKKTCA